MKADNNVICEPEVIIQNNIMSFKKSTIQLSNISQLAISPMPKKEYPMGLFFAVVIGLLCFFVFQGNLRIIGMVAAVIGGLGIGYVYMENSDAGSYLMLDLNSGSKVLLSSKNESFLIEAQKAIEACLQGSEGITMNFNNCTIQRSNIGGQGNIVNNGNATIVTISEVDWKELETFFAQLKISAHNNNSVYNLACRGQRFVISKDREGLAKLIKDNYDNFKSNMLSNFATDAIKLIFKTLTGLIF
ncbi:MAG: hypothetical protein ACRDBO_10890 [Lachnospiraceae bacterium]